MIAPGRSLTDSAAEIEALFAEARRRRRRRRIAGAAVCLTLAGGTLAAVTAGGPLSHRAPVLVRTARPPAVARPRPLRLSLPPDRVAWVDYLGQLHVGDVATRVQRVAATVPSASGGSLTRAGGYLYWADVAQNVAPIRGYDLATGKLRYLPRGQSVFASGNGRRLYIVVAGRKLIELRPDGRGPRRVLRVPAGWSASCCRWEGTAAAGIVVYSAVRGATEAGIWRPAAGTVTPLRSGMVIDDVYTPPRAGYSLVAWAPAACGRGFDCPLKITDTGTSATLTVPSPLRHGFTTGDGAFSPNGRWLAVFARRAGLSSNWANHSELALVSTRTGRLRLDPAARLITQEDAGWVTWLPGSRRLLAGALWFSYAVATRTLATRPFFFFPGTTDHNIMDTPDINFSSVIIPAR